MHVYPSAADENVPSCFQRILAVRTMTPTNYEWVQAAEKADEGRVKDELRQ